tara:strand:+ start:4998 stop:5291 length:294 start_codon:yes stop_codon:yes gene_type:complete
MALKINTDGITRDATAEEEAAILADRKTWDDASPTRLAKDHREKRNELLSETDWTQGRDVVLSNDAAWKTYRQALRDLPTHSSFPNLKDSDYPTKPS